MLVHQVKAPERILPKGVPVETALLVELAQLGFVQELHDRLAGFLLEDPHAFGAFHPLRKADHHVDVMGHYYIAVESRAASLALGC
jgi:hypothetical protein